MTEFLFKGKTTPFNCDIIKDGILGADPSTTGGSRITKMPPAISIARLFGSVNDRNGKKICPAGCNPRAGLENKTMTTKGA